MRRRDGKAEECIYSRAERTRTSDTRFRKPLLYPLSYSPGNQMISQSSTNLAA